MLQRSLQNGRVAEWLMCICLPMTSHSSALLTSTVMCPTATTGPGKHSWLRSQKPFLISLTQLSPDFFLVSKTPEEYRAGVNEFSIASNSMPPPLVRSERPPRLSMELFTQGILTSQGTTIGIGNDQQLSGKVSCGNSRMATFKTLELLDG